MLRESSAAGDAGAGSRKAGSRRDRNRRASRPTYALVEEDMEWDTEEAPPLRQSRLPPQRRPPPLRDDSMTGYGCALRICRCVLAHDWMLVPTSPLIVIVAGSENLA